MKYIIKIALSLIIVLALGACQSTEKAEKKEPFVVYQNSVGIPAGSFEAYFDKLLSLESLSKMDVNVEYYPREDAVALQFKQDFITYTQFWSRSGRLAFLKAIEEYKKDYDERNLAKGSRKRFLKYGLVEGFITWQTASFTIKARAFTQYRLGFTIKNKAAWFTVLQDEAYYEDPVSRDNNRTCQDITMFFTRAQADELAALFDQAYLNGLADKNRGKEPSKSLEVDSY